VTRQQSGIPLQTERTYTHHMLCCRITTLTVVTEILDSVHCLRRKCHNATEAECAPLQLQRGRRSIQRQPFYNELVSIPGP